jgi:hypothetical protein
MAITHFRCYFINAVALFVRDMLIDIAHNLDGCQDAQHQ